MGGHEGSVVINGIDEGIAVGFVLGRYEVGTTSGYFVGIIEGANDCTTVGAGVGTTEELFPNVDT